MVIYEQKHPEYITNEANWLKYRLTINGGRKFVEAYLRQLTTREDYIDYSDRKFYTYCPAHAKAVLIEIKNAFSQRIQDVTRTNGPTNYSEAVASNIDSNQSSMNVFVSTQLVLDLLSMGRVGVYIDKPLQSTDRTMVERPYLYKYATEDIYNWKYNEQGQLTSVLLHDIIPINDEKTDLVTGMTDRYRLLRLTELGVEVTLYDASGIAEKPIILQLEAIPFVIFEIDQSLLVDVADYQISLLNIESMDIQFLIKANSPFYTEQYDASMEWVGKQKQKEVVGTETEAKTSGKKHITTGPSHGRRYGKGLDAPSFIHPSAEPLLASVAKQAALKSDMRTLVGLALESLGAKRVSADSKKEDRVGKEEGLAAVGAELEHGENQIAAIWADYENGEAAIVRYPRNYSLRTDADRREEATELKKLQLAAVSPFYQQLIAKEIVKVLVGHLITTEQLTQIYDEIEAQNIVNIDPDTLIKDVEAGLASAGTVSQLRGYGEGEAAKAQEEKALRAAKILEAQTAAARGVPDLGGDGQLDKIEQTGDDKPTRGEGQ